MKVMEKTHIKKENKVGLIYYIDGVLLNGEVVEVAFSVLSLFSCYFIRLH
jgi:hypothetical protein